jgi:hypothetical protein
VAHAGVAAKIHVLRFCLTDRIVLLQKKKARVSGLFSYKYILPEISEQNRLFHTVGSLISCIFKTVQGFEESV